MIQATGPATPAEWRRVFARIADSQIAALRRRATDDYTRTLSIEHPLERLLEWRARLEAPAPRRSHMA